MKYRSEKIIEILEAQLLPFPDNRDMAAQFDLVCNYIKYPRGYNRSLQRLYLAVYTGLYMGQA